MTQDLINRLNEAADEERAYREHDNTRTEDLFREAAAELQRLVNASGVIVGEPLRGDETFVELFKSQLEKY